MKYANVEEKTNKLIGWYDSNIHTHIPEHTIEVTHEQWLIAINNNHNKVNYDGTTELYDFRTSEEIELDNEMKKNIERKSKMLEGEVYTLNNTDYQISFTKDDGDGLVQVKSAFDLGLTSTIIHFENGTKFPITTEEFSKFALWFVERRNSFFEV